MNKLSNILIIVVGVILLAYIAGPKVRYDEPVFFDTEPIAENANPEEWLNAKESVVADLKPGNNAQIVWWNDSLNNKTEYVLVYFHGFSASHEEGNPVHRDFAKRYGANLLLTRLQDHGRSDPYSFESLTPDSYIQSAEEAIEVAKSLGDKIIVMATSTGATIAAILASKGENIHALILYSPNIDLQNRTSNIAVYPWGKQMAQLVLGGSQYKVKYNVEAAKYWSESYHMNGIFVVKSLIRDFMNKETFNAITIPVFVGYYYKNDKDCDKIISVSRIQDFFEQLGTPESEKRIVKFANVGNHVMTSPIMSKDIESVKKESYAFAEEILNLLPVEK